MSSSKIKILVTGGTGFIGRNVVEHFARNPSYDVHATCLSRPAPDIKNVTFHKCDLRNPAAVDEILKGTDILIQAAATTSGAKDIVNSPSLHVTDNAIMNSYIMRSAAQAKIKQVIFFSCTVMYPDSSAALREEDVDYNGIFPKYFGVAWTKLYVEKICEFYSRNSNTRFTVIRHSNIYGPYDKFDLERSHVFGATVTKVMIAKDEVVVWGEGKESRDLLYISDLLLFIESSFKQSSAFEVTNVGLGKNITIAGLVQEIISASGKSLQIKYDLSKPTIPTNTVIDISKALRVYGWKPQTSLQDGIKKTLEWYKQNVL